jgi:osmotically inducible protein OsmC
MPVRTADARWEGTLQDGKGTMRMGGGAWEGPYSFTSRFEEGTGTNPEELIAAAHAGCFSMALSGALGRAGHPPQSVATTAKVHINRTDEGFRIQKIELTTDADVPGISQAEFDEIAEGAKKGCPVSVALGGVGEIVLNATLTS